MKFIFLTWLGLPLLFGFALNVYHEFFFPRFVLYIVPAILILAAHGLMRVARWTNRRFALAGLTALIGLLWLPTLRAHYAAPTAPADDWRPVAAALRPLTRAGDAAIYVWGWIPGYLAAYLPPAPQPDYALGYFTPETLDAQMTALTAGRERVWLLDHAVDQFDVRNQAGRWLGPRAALVYAEWPGGGSGHIALFVLRPTPTTTLNMINHTFANGLQLETAEVQAALAAGDAVAVQLVWTPTQTLVERYTIFLHLQDESGALMVGRDSEPRNGLAAVTDWLAGEHYPELRGLVLPPDLPPGRYRLSVGLYQTLTGEVDPGGPVIIGAVEVKSLYKTKIRLKNSAGF